MTAWLTRIVPDIARTDVRGDLRDSVAMHRRVMSLFPDDPAVDEARRHFGILYRVDHAVHGPASASGVRASGRAPHIGIRRGPSASAILMQSTTAPDPDRLPPGYALDTASRSIDALLDALRPGRYLRYCCDANPIRKPGHTTREMYGLPAVVPLKGRHADEWWHRQANKSGLKIYSHQSHPLDPATGRRPAKKPGASSHRIHHDRVRFEGTAEIVDPDALRASVLSGIGRGRAYGCGLLSIAPIRSPHD